MHRRARRGLARTFQINQLFASFTPLQTMALAVAERDGLGLRMLRALARRPAVLDEAAALLREYHLADVMERKVRELPYGKQRLLEIAIAVAGRPRVLLRLDEPAAGVPAGEFGGRSSTRSAAGLPADVTVLLIEHWIWTSCFRFARRISVLVNGALLAEGTADEVAADPIVKAV